MSADLILADWKKNIFRPICWLEGEEEYFIDQVMDFAEHRILSEQEASFNLSIFYGRDTSWQDLLNTCRRYPMFAERQVVLLKEAQLMREIDGLGAYLEKPMPTTVLVVSYKNKKLDGRKALAATIKKKGHYLLANKINDRDLPEWMMGKIREKGVTITDKALLVLIDHVGNDLVRLMNELNKIRINLEEGAKITEDHVESFVGISKEYNVFELQNAIAVRNLPKAIRIINYFEANPKAGPIQMIIPTLSSFFQKVYMVCDLMDADDASITTITGIKAFVKQYRDAARLYQRTGVEKAILLMHHFNLRSIGIYDTGPPGASLLKEMVTKIILG